MSPKSKVGMTGRVALGFTLIELLVVISIVALLVALLLPSLAAANLQAKTTKCSSNMRGLASAMFIYATDNKQIMPAQSVFDNATDACRYQGGIAGFGWKALTRASAGDTSVSVDSGYVERSNLIGCPAKVSQAGKGRMVNDLTNGVYGFGNGQVVHYGYRYNALLLTTTYGVDIARSNGDLVGQTSTNGNTPNSSKSWQHPWYRRRAQTLLWDDSSFGLHFAGGNLSTEKDNLFVNADNWGHRFGGNIILVDGSGRFVKNAINNITFAGSTNTPSVYVGWPTASYSGQNCSDINPWDSRVNNIAGFVDLLLTVGQ